MAAVGCFAHAMRCEAQLVLPMMDASHPAQHEVQACRSPGLLMAICMHVCVNFFELLFIVDRAKLSQPRFIAGAASLQTIVLEDNRFEQGIIDHSIAAACLGHVPQRTPEYILHVLAQTRCIL